MVLLKRNKRASIQVPVNSTKCQSDIVVKSQSLSMYFWGHFFRCRLGER